MIGPNNQPMYYLVYGTKHPLGLEVMKEALYKVDRRGRHTFSDLTDVNQTYIIDYQEASHWIPKAAEMVYVQFTGREAQESEVHDFVVTRTPYIYRKSVLRYLESCRPPKIERVTGRKKRFSYPEGCTIRFCS